MQTIKKLILVTAITIILTPPVSLYAMRRPALSAEEQKLTYAMQATDPIWEGDPKWRVPSQNNSLIVAARRGDLHAVQYILHHRIDIKTVKELGQAALIEATHNGYTDIVQTLLNAGVDPDADDCLTALMIAVDNKHHEIVDLLIAARANLDSQDITTKNPLMRAIMKTKQPSIKIITTLINAKANLELPYDYYGEQITILDIAASSLIIDTDINI
jgi:ankyrin repeat protein